MREQRKKLPSVTTLEEMGLVEVDDDVVRLTPAPGSGLREVEEFLNCGLAIALDVVEAAQRRAA